MERREPGNHGDGNVLPDYPTLTNIHLKRTFNDKSKNHYYRNDGKIKTKERLLLQIYNWFYLGHVVGHRMRATQLRRWRHTNSCSGSSGYNAVWKVSYWPRWRHSRSRDKLSRSTFLTILHVSMEFICEGVTPSTSQKKVSCSPRVVNFLSKT